MKSERNPIISEDAQKALVEFTYNTSPEKMPEMTIVSARQAYHLAQQMVFRDVRKYVADLAKYHSDPETNEKPELFFASERWMYYFMQLQRSIGGQTFKQAAALTQVAVEVAADTDYAGEADQWK